MASDLINPAKFPTKSEDLKLSEITGSADDLRTMGKTLNSKTDAIKSKWADLTACYEAPEQDQVYALMDQPATDADDVKDVFDKAAGYIDTYRSDIEAVKPDLESLEEDAQKFRDRVKDGVMVNETEAADAGFGTYLHAGWNGITLQDQKQVKVHWYEDTDTANENEGYLVEYAKILERISTAASTCANGINGLVTGKKPETVEALPAEAFVNPEAPMPWGSPRDEERNCPESAKHGVWDEFVVGTAQGFGGLIGYNPVLHEWGDGDYAKQSWSGLGNLAAAIGNTVNPLGWAEAGIAHACGNDEALNRQTDAWDTLVTAGAGLIGINRNSDDPTKAWKDDPWSTGISSVLNVATFFVPVGGAVAGGAKGGSKGAQILATVARGSEAVLPGASHLFSGATKVTGKLNALFRIGDDLPVGAADDAARTGLGRATGDVDDLIERVGDLPERRTPVSDNAFGNDPVPNPRDTTPSNGPRSEGNPGSGTPHGDGPAADSPRRSHDGTPSGPHANDGSGSGSHGNGTGSRDGSGSQGDGSGTHGNHDGPGTHDGARNNDGSGDNGGSDNHDGSSNTPHDPRHTDTEPWGDKDYVGTIDPDTGLPRGTDISDIPQSELLSDSGLTMNGRLIDADNIPAQLEPYLSGPDAPLTIDNGIIRLSDETTVTFDHSNPNHDAAEFARQAHLQEQSLNQMSVKDWADNVEAYQERAANTGNGRTDAAAQSNYRRDWIEGRADDLAADGSMTPAEARAQANAEAKGQAVLHGPDQVAGGNPKQFTGLGDTGVNSSFGNQWGAGRAEMLSAKMEAKLDELGIPESLWGDVRMNVRLNVNHTVPGGV